MQIIVVCLLVGIIFLQAYIVYLLSQEPEPAAADPGEFPAEQILKDIERDFDRVMESMDKPKNGPQADDGMNPQERTIPRERRINLKRQDDERPQQERGL